MNYPEVESTVQYSTVQYDVKNVMEGRREGKKGRGPGSVFYLDGAMWTGHTINHPFSLWTNQKHVLTN